MSAFMVSDETVNCVCTIDALASGPCARRDAFGRELLAMNSAALAARYGDELQTAADFSFRFFPRKYSLIQQYKALQCLSYQCAEGNVPEWPLYRQLDAALDGLAMAIAPWSATPRDAIYNLPEYNDAEWCLADRPRGKVTA